VLARPRWPWLRTSSTLRQAFDQAQHLDPNELKPRVVQARHLLQNGKVTKTSSGRADKKDGMA